MLAALALALALLAAPAASAASAHAAQAAGRHLTGPQARAGHLASVPLSFRQVFLAKLPYDNSLFSVEATSRSDAWAVGGNDLAYHDFPDYAVHWNGTKWIIVHLPDSRLVPVSVRASARNDVWIFGTHQSSASNFAEALRWDGAAWHVMTLPPTASLLRPVVLGKDDVWLSGTATWTRATPSGHAERAAVMAERGRAPSPGHLAVPRPGGYRDPAAPSHQTARQRKDGAGGG